MRFKQFFSLHFVIFVMKTIFYDHFKNVRGFFRNLIWNKHFLCMHTCEKSHLNETNLPWINFWQYGGGYSVWRRRVQYMATKTAQGIVGGCIYLEKWYFTDNITQISSYCDESRCSWDPFRMLIWLHLDPLIIPVWFYGIPHKSWKNFPKYLIMFEN